MSAILRPSVFYSQNYLKDPRLVASLLAKSSIGLDDIVYEIGPGKGIITGQLSLHCKQVVGIEKDPRLAALLARKFAQQPKVIIQEGDFLHYPLPRFPYKVFANIPFNITSAIVTRLTMVDNPPEDAYLVMQKEAADTYLGEPHESLRAVLMKPWFEVGIVHRFRRKDFSPEPRVNVVMLCLKQRRQPLVSPQNGQRFRDFVVYGFTTWCPTLGQILKGIFTSRQLKRIGKELGIDLKSTPTAISFEQWLNLFAFFLDSSNAQAIQTISGREKQLNRQQKSLAKVHRTRISR